MSGVVDRLRMVWNRPLRDGDRPRLFAIVVALIAGAAAVLTQIERPGPSPRAQPPDGPQAPVATAAEPVPKSAASVPPPAPKEEGTRTPVPASRADVAASKQAARRFLARYLPYTYGRGRARRIRPATAALRRRLAAQRPRVPARERRRRPWLVLLQSDTVGHRHTELVTLVGDGRRRYTVALELARTRAGWQVERVGS
jgi:hypothetical protein